jgi:dethiobiotin synthetase
MRGWFVTGTDTEIGKTRTSCGLLRAFAAAGLRSAGMKPVASGSVRTPDGLRNEDALALQQSASVPLPYELVNPYAFEQPIAPHIAAAEAGVRIELQPILDAYAQVSARSEVTIVEGVGGWCVPLSNQLTLPQLARALGLPVIMVVGMRLGCLNHAVLTARAIHEDDLQLAGWVANGIAAEFPRAQENLAMLREAITAPLLGEVPHAPDPQAHIAGRHLAGAVARLMG